MVTTSPGSAAPVLTRHTPTPSTASTPRLGSASMAGSKAARSRPARMPSSRSCRALAAKRSVSSPSRPSVLTTIAPSKDSWAISLSSARSAWMRVNTGEDTRWKITLATITTGKTSSPTTRHHEVGEEHLGHRDHHHRERPDGHRQRREGLEGGLDVGVGVGQQLAGGVLLVPGHRQREVLARHLAAVGRLDAVLHHPGARAAGRRCRPPAGSPPRRRARARRSGHRSSSSRSSNAGSSTWSVAQPSTHASATVSAPKSRLPAVESEKISGWRRIATPSTRKPSRSVDPAAGSVRLSGAETGTAVVTRLQP